MSVPFYDWLGRYKLVDFGGYTALCGPNAGFLEAAEWWMMATGKRPDIRNTYEVDSAFYERWKDSYEVKGLLFDGGGNGGNEL